ncbi:MAG: translation initiation factor IF-2 subunit gamma [Candidatus Thermoplasmatota archaeon]|nr:translation initiation factor IF-2 subunit gamma [Candidatus Thermoplasmatota archaeon]
MRVEGRPEVNIGMIGHVDHGKTTLTKVISGTWTDRHSEEIKRGITIKLGYADASFYKCPKCEGHAAYTTKKKCPNCDSECEFLRTVSFVDAPGHETLMATMLSGAAIMNGAILLIAANEKCPQPQTKEHLMALTISDVKNIIIVQNKIDIVDEEHAIQNYQQIKEFVKGTIGENAPILPICAQRGENIDVLLEAINEFIPSPEPNPDLPPRMHIARSFDVNNPGSSPEELIGGILGGTLTQGELKMGDEIEIRPGIKTEVKGKVIYEPIHSTIVSLHSGSKKVDAVGPGGLIAIGTNLDPAMTKSDSLIGKVVGKSETLPNVLHEITMEVKLLDRVVGAASEVEVETLNSNEPLMLSVGTATTVGTVTSARDNIANVRLKIPICAEAEQGVAISRRISGRWRLIGYGIMK